MLWRDVAQLASVGLLCGHVTAAPAYGGEHEALSVAGALDAAAHGLDWDVAIVGPGPGIIGSDTRLGHGGLAALDSAHAALALGMPTLLSPRLSAGDPRQRHRGVSHHTLTVMRDAAGRGRGRGPGGQPRSSTAQARRAAAWHHKLRESPLDLAASPPPACQPAMGRTLEEDPLFFAAAARRGRRLAPQG